MARQLEIFSPQNVMRTEGRLRHIDEVVSRDTAWDAMRVLRRGVSLKPDLRRDQLFLTAHGELLGELLCGYLDRDLWCEAKRVLDDSNPHYIAALNHIAPLSRNFGSNSRNGHRRG